MFVSISFGVLACVYVHVLFLAWLLSFLMVEMLTGNEYSQYKISLLVAMICLFVFWREKEWDIGKEVCGSRIYVNDIFCIDLWNMQINFIA